MVTIKRCLCKINSLVSNKITLILCLETLIVPHSTPCLSKKMGESFVILGLKSQFHRFLSQIWVFFFNKVVSSTLIRVCLSFLVFLSLTYCDVFCCRLIAIGNCVVNG